MERHSESRKLIDLPVLTTNTTQEIYMPDVAPEKVVMASGSLKLDSADDEDVSPYYKHTAQLQLNRGYASNIKSDIISAKTYSGIIPLIYVLITHNDKYHWLVYEPKSKQLRSPTVVKLLDLIACNENTETALVESDEIEALSDDCVYAWCTANDVPSSEVIRECALYLKPIGEGDAVSDWLSTL